MEDTIAAISTAVGQAGIAIIRVSGPHALDVADEIFYSPRGRPSTFSTHTIHFGTIGRNGDLIDQVMLSVLHGPRTYTGENTIEINCHGGSLNTRKILTACLNHGARLAEPGEFTKRAFLNGKLDLTQAEAVMDLIAAKSDRAHTAAANALEGHLAVRVNKVRDILIEVLAHIEAYIDFPEDDIAPETLMELRAKLASVVTEIEILLRSARDGRILREGIRVAIVGRPNAGKSSLMNALLGQDRAIVTPIAGTTRDTLEELTSIGGIPVILTDTAGVRTARGQVERLGVERGQKSVTLSDIIIHVIDTSRPFHQIDLEIASCYRGKNGILALNKSDRPRHLKLPDSFAHLAQISVSCLTRDGLDSLRGELCQFALESNTSDLHLDAIINDRHEQILDASLNTLTNAILSIDRKNNYDLISQDIRISLQSIGEIVGITTTDDILDKVFSTFCIGK
jgi:tRNA modification GTPase